MDIKFTLGKETHGSISFLDVLIKRYENKFITSWFSKPVFSGRYLNFLSVQPYAQKVNVVKNLAKRVCQLSHPMHRENAIRSAKQLLRQNCYPNTLINSIFADIVNCCYNGFPLPRLQDKSEMVVLPYMPSVSKKLSSLLKPHNLTVVNSNKNSLGNFHSSLKASTPKDKLSNVVYEIPCKDCADVYIGQTSQYVHKRMDGHRFNKNEVTALKQHIKEKNHSFDYDNVKILCREEKLQVRLNLEGICILKENNAVNSRAEFHNFSEYFVNPTLL